MKRTTVAVLCIAAVGIMSAVKITEEKFHRNRENKEREETDETASVGAVYEINQIHEDVFTRIQKSRIRLTSISTENFAI